MAFEQGNKAGMATQFKEGQSGNPNGRPRSIHLRVVEALEQEGYERVSRSQVAELYEMLISLPETKLKELAKAEAVPVAVKILAKGLTGRRAFDVLETMLDRAHGKPKQTLAGDQDNPLFDSNIKIEFNSSGVQPITSEQQIAAMLAMQADE